MLFGAERQSATRVAYTVTQATLRSEMTFKQAPRAELGKAAEPTPREGGRAYPSGRRPSLAWICSLSSRARFCSALRHDPSGFFRFSGCEGQPSFALTSLS